MRLSFTSIQLALGKHLAAIGAGFFLAMAIATRDLTFLFLALFFAGITFTHSAIQVGLDERKSWARKVAIGMSIVQLPSLLFPLAMLSLRDLFRPEIAREFSSGRQDKQREKRQIRGYHRAAAIVLATTCAIFVLTCLVFGNGLGFKRKPNVSISINRSLPSAFPADFSVSEDLIKGV